MLTRTLFIGLMAATLLSSQAFADHDTEGGAAHDHATHTDMHHTASEWQAGDLTVTAPFSRATLPNAPVAGGFMTIRNNGTQDDRLVGASSDVAGRMEVHEMIVDGDIMKMHELVDGLPIPAGGTVELRPGGYHIMFMELKQPLAEGETVDVTVTFERTGNLTVPLAIQAFNASTDGHAHDDSHAGH